MANEPESTLLGTGSISTGMSRNFLQDGYYPMLCTLDTDKKNNFDLIEDGTNGMKSKKVNGTCFQYTANISCVFDTLH